MPRAPRVAHKVIGPRPHRQHRDDEQEHGERGMEAQEKEWENEKVWVADKWTPL